MSKELKKKFAKILPQMNPAVRRAVVYHHSTTDSTLSRYLNGHFQSEKTAQEIYAACEKELRKQTLDNAKFLGIECKELK